MSMTPASNHEHDRVVTAFFDTRAAAEKAKVEVLALGLGQDTVTITEGRSATGQTGAAGTADAGEGFWGSLKNIFAPEDDKHAYAEALHRGGFLLTAHTGEADYDRVIHILDSEGAVDMDERETQWRKEGWTGRNEGYATAYGGSTAATNGTAGTSAVGTSTAATSGTTARDTGLMGRTDATTAGIATGGTEQAALAGGTLGGTGEEVIPIAEERLRVGKRDINHGRVRLRSYVVEKPVNEAVSLRSERIDVSRRPVDRALGAGENLFQERTISAEEHDEEAVVSKEARVVEEVRLGKVAQERTQEIHDTVRRTEVETDDGRTGRVGAVGAVGTAVEEIAAHMAVLASDGTRIGTVDHLDGTDRIKLAKNDAADGQHHFIPRGWVSRVDEHVHLAKTAAEVRGGWKTI